MQSRNEFDKDSDGAVSEEEAKEYMSSLDSVDEDTFISTVWPNINNVITLNVAADGQGDPLQPPPIDDELHPPAMDDEDDDDDDGDDDFDEVLSSSIACKVDSYHDLINAAFFKYLVVPVPCEHNSMFCNNFLLSCCRMTSMTTMMMMMMASQHLFNQRRLITMTMKCHLIQQKHWS